MYTRNNTCCYVRVDIDLEFLSYKFENNEKFMKFCTVCIEFSGVESSDKLLLLPRVEDRL